MLYLGYVFVRSGQPTGRTVHWECTRLRKRGCSARATTVGNFVKKCGDHLHPPDREQTEAEELQFKMKQKAEDNPEMPLSLILREDLRGVSPGVLARLPERKNLKKAMRRKRRVELPPNPSRITDLGELPPRFRNTLNGENFLILDNQQPNKRVIAFATQRNLEVLSRSTIWFLDGTFKVTINL